MTLTVTPVLAGSGTDYLQRQVASGREDWLPSSGLGGAADYYSSGEVAGERPGVWLGRQAQEWGLAGEPVTRQQMDLLVGAACHPTSAQQLGSKHPVIRTVEERLAELDERADQMTPEDLEAAKAKVRAGGDRAARGGFDCTFSPPKSVSVLWAAAPSRELAEAVWAAHREAVEAGLDRLEADAGLTRAGAGGVRQIDAAGLAAMAFEHRTSREQDPQIHTHVVVANRVQGADGKWRSLDSRALYRASTAAAGVYEATLWAGLARLGLRVTPGAGPSQVEIAGVDTGLLTLFSTRRQQIEAALGDRLESLTGRTLRRAAQIATLATRRKKPDEPQTSNQLRSGWQQQMRDAGHDPAGVWDAARVAAAGTIVPGWSPVMVDAVVAACADATVSVEAAAARVLGRGLDRDDREPVRVLRRVVAAAVPGRTVDAALRMLEDEKGHWTRANAANAVARVLALHPNLGALEGGVDAAVRAVTGRLLADPRVVTLTPDDGWQVPAGLRRADGSSVYERTGERVYATTRVLDVLEGEVLTAAATPGATVYTAEQVDAAVTALAVAEGGEIPVSTAQQAAVTEVLGRDSRVRALLGAAGAGKTSTLRVVVQAAQARGLSVVGLAPSQIAANVLGEATGMTTANMAAFASGSPAGAAARDAVRPGTLVVIDEAGMASTAQLHRVVTQVLAGGGDVLLVGDPDQLGAVGAGGMLATIAARIGAPTLLEVRRFSSEWEAAASLRLRAGDPAAVADYARHGRVVDGTQEDLLARFAAATAGDLLAGRDAILVAGSNEVAASAAAGVRDLLVQAGRVDDGVTVALADGTRAGVGDLVVTRLNEHAEEIANRDVWRVVEARADGGLRVQRHTSSGSGHGGGDGEGEPQLLRAGYVRAHVQLAYAGTVHAAQGRTVTTSRVLVTAHDDRHLLYVGATRGRDRNEIGAVTEPSVEALVGWIETKTPEQLLAEVVARSGNAVTATDAAAAQVERQTHMTRLVAIHHDLFALSLTPTASLTPTVEGRPDEAAGGGPGGGIVGWVAAVDPDAAARLAGDPAMPALVRAVARAARGGVDPAELVRAAAAARPLGDVADVAAALQWRVTRMAGLMPAAAAGPGIDEPAAWMPALVGPSPAAGTDLAGTAAAVARTAGERVRLLGRRVGEQSPAWAAALGPFPADAGATVRGDWIARAGVVAAYRELVGRGDTEPGGPIGPPPRDPDTRRAWVAADAALAGVHLPGRVWRADPATLRGLAVLAGQVEADRPVWVGDRLTAAGITEAAAQLAVDEAQVVAAVAAAGPDADPDAALRAAAAATDLARAQDALTAATAARETLQAADTAARAYGAAHRDTLLAGRWAARLLPLRDPDHTTVADLTAARALLNQPATPAPDAAAPTAPPTPAAAVVGATIPTRPLPRHTDTAAPTGHDTPVDTPTEAPAPRTGTGTIPTRPLPHRDPATPGHDEAGAPAAAAVHDDRPEPTPPSGDDLDTAGGDTPAVDEASSEAEQRAETYRRAQLVWKQVEERFGLNRDDYSYGNDDGYDYGSRDTHGPGI